VEHGDGMMIKKLQQCSLTEAVQNRSLSSDSSALEKNCQKVVVVVVMVVGKVSK
jgi:hypothetical protein